MKIGICCGFEQAEGALSLGYDYVEFSLTAIEAMAEGEFRALADKGHRVYACNSMIPAKYRLTGPEADLHSAWGYCERAAGCAAALGVGLVVFGSAGARNLPEGTSAAEGYRQLAEYLSMAGDVFGGRGIRLAVEPLGKAESNIVHFVAEGMYLAGRSGSRNVGALADLNHMDANGEGMDGILAAGPRLWHCHIANSRGRLFPRAGDGQEARYRAFFGALRAVGYEGGVSVEASTQRFAEDAEAALSCLRALA